MIDSIALKLQSDLNTITFFGLMFYPIMKRVVEIELHTTQQQSSGGGDEVELGGKRVGRRPRESMLPSLMKIVESRELPGPPDKTAYLTRHHSHNIAYVSPLPLSRRYFLEKHLNLTFFLLFPLFLAVSTEIAKTVWAVARKPSFLLSQVTCIYQCLQPFFVLWNFLS